jgi:hypothetical protein
MARQRDFQVSVPLPPQLRIWLEAQAEAEDRTLAGVVRHLVAEAARQAGAMSGGTHARL